MTDAPLRIYIDRGPRGGWMHRHERMPDTRHVYIEETREALAQSPIVQAMITDAMEGEVQKRRDRAAYENMWASRGTE